MRGLGEVEQLGHFYPARQHRHVRDEANVAHQLLALPERIETQHRQLPIAVRQAEQRLEQGCLAGAVGAEEAHDLAFFYVEADVVNGVHFAETL